MSKTDLSDNSIEVEEDLICEYCDKEFITTKECSHHERTCKAKGAERSYGKKTPMKQKTGCLICGAAKHLSPDCYITRDVS